MFIFSTVLSHEISISSGRTQTSVCWPTSESLWCLLVKNNLLGSEKMVVKLFDRTLYGRTRLWLAGFKWCLLKLLKTNSFQNALVKKKEAALSPWFWVQSDSYNDFQRWWPSQIPPAPILSHQTPCPFHVYSSHLLFFPSLSLPAPCLSLHLFSVPFTFTVYSTLWKNA